MQPLAQPGQPRQGPAQDKATEEGTPGDFAHGRDSLDHQFRDLGRMREWDFRGAWDGEYVDCRILKQTGSFVEGGGLGKTAAKYRYHLATPTGTVKQKQHPDFPAISPSTAESTMSAQPPQPMECQSPAVGTRPLGSVVPGSVSRSALSRSR